jgi:hypothetical protein
MHTRHEFFARCLERQLVAKCIDLVEVEIGGRPARQPTRAASHVWRHVRIAIAVSADPRAKAHRGRIDRQSASGALAECAIHCAGKARHRIPQTLLEDDETTADFVEGRWPLLTHLARRPGTFDLPAQCSDELVTLEQGEIGPIACGQRASNAIVLLDDATARHLGRMGRQYQLDV